MIGTICAVLVLAIARQQFLVGQWSGDELRAATHKLALRKARFFLPASVVLLLALGYILVQGKKWAGWLLLAIAFAGKMVSLRAKGKASDLL